MARQIDLPTVYRLLEELRQLDLKQQAELNSQMAGEDEMPSLENPDLTSLLSSLNSINAGTAGGATVDVPTRLAPISWTDWVTPTQSSSSSSWTPPAAAVASSSGVVRNVRRPSRAIVPRFKTEEEVTASADAREQKEEMDRITAEAMDLVMARAAGTGGTGGMESAGTSLRLAPYSMPKSATRPMIGKRQHILPNGEIFTERVIIPMTASTPRTRLSKAFKSMSRVQYPGAVVPQRD
jgi:hypothetical protein